MSFLFIIVAFALMWAVLIRPQQQRLRRQRALVFAIEVGDEVVTAGGMVGRIMSMDDDQVVLEIAPHASQLTFLRAAINRNLSAEARTATGAAGTGTDPAGDGPSERPEGETP
jgi:preprotein translocase subunit YajC